jgi:predicted peptidase
MWLLFATVAASNIFAQDQPTNVTPEQDRLTTQSSTAAKLEYLLFLPSDYGKSGRKWPLMVFLHGAGECGTNLNLLKRNGPTKYVLTHPEFPFILVSPQTRGGWDDSSVTALLDDVLRRYRVERSQVFLTGLSMGGCETWRLAAKYPERFAAVVPVSGVGDPETARKLATVPIWAFHGGRDQIISVECSRKMVAAITSAGGSVKYTEYPNAKHNIWAKTYNNPELYGWLLAQKRLNAW